MIYTMLYSPPTPCVYLIAASLIRDVILRCVSLGEGCFDFNNSWMCLSPVTWYCVVSTPLNHFCTPDT